MSGSASRAAAGPDRPAAPAGLAARLPAGFVPGAVALVLLTAAVFGRTGSFPFVDYDDPMYVRDNPPVLGGLSASFVGWAFTTFHIANWHPLTWISHALDVTLFGPGPGPHHLVSVAIHAVNAVLLLLFLQRATGRPGPALFAAAFFAVHPLRAESVAWVAERKDVLCTFFLLLTLFAWRSYTREPSPRRYAVVALTFALGLLSKPMVVTTPVLLLALDVWPLRRIAWDGPGFARRAWPLVREKLPLLALSAVSAALTVEAQRAWGAVRAMAEVPLADRLANAVVALSLYFGKTLWPAGLCVFYPLRPVPGIAVAASFALACAITALAIAHRARRPYLLAGWAWYLVTLAPVIGIVQVGEQALADRYTYIPMIGPVCAVAWWIADLVADRPRARRALAAAGAVTVLVFAALCTRQVATWRSTEALFTHAIGVTGENWLGEAVLAVHAEGQGRLDEAIARGRRAAAQKPGDAQILTNLGHALVAAGRRDEGVASLREAVERAPRLVPALNNLGVALAQGSDLAAAEALFRRAIEVRPTDAMGHFNLGMALKLTGRGAEALVHFREAARLDPADEDARAQVEEGSRAR